MARRGLDFNIDRRQLDRAIARAPQAVNRGASRALSEIRDDWQLNAVNEAPLDTGRLRQSIESQVLNPGSEGAVEIRGNAIRSGFNYGYYIHEQDAGGRSVNGTKEFLKKSADDNIDKWAGWLEEEIERELRGAGF